MPLVRIDLMRGKPAVYRQDISVAIHRALVSVVGIPQGDCFHVLTEHEAENFVYDAHFLGIERSADVIFVQIVLRRGRSPDVRQELYRQIVHNLAESPGIRSEDVLIALVENDPVDWSVGNGEAQLLRSLPAQLPTGPTAIR